MSSWQRRRAKSKNISSLGFGLASIAIRRDIREATSNEMHVSTSLDMTTDGSSWRGVFALTVDLIQSEPSHVIP